MNSDGLKARYPWLAITTTIEDYVAPEYYDKLLKDYVFDGETDLEIFSEFLKKIPPRNDMGLLELGCGSGRVTNVALSWLGVQQPPFRIVDLSGQMIAFTKDRFATLDNLVFTQSDSVKFLEETLEKYDLAFSLWSFSHSVHQILTREGLEEGTRYVRSVLRKFFTENMNPGSSFFLIHFDSMSDEQRILLNQWKKVFLIFADTTRQSPGKRLIDDELEAMARDGIVTFEIKHRVGKEIVYASQDEALEIFLNFHAESYFNELDILPEVVNEMQQYFASFTDESGKVRIKPGCFIYEIKRN